MTVQIKSKWLSNPNYTFELQFAHLYYTNFWIEVALGIFQ